MVRKGSVLVVDDEFLIVDLLVTMLQDMGLEVCGTAASSHEAVVLAKAHEPDLVLMDVRLKGQPDGIEAAKAIRQATGASVIFITGSGEASIVARIEREQPTAVLYKPIRFEQLKYAVLYAVSGRRTVAGSKSGFLGH